MIERIINFFKQKKKKEKIIIYTDFHIIDDEGNITTIENRKIYLKKQNGIKKKNIYNNII